MPVGTQHSLFGIFPCDHLLLDLGKWCVAIPVIEGFNAEPFGFELVIAMGQARIGGLHRRNERIYHFAFHPIGKMTRIRNIGKTAPSVGNILVLGQSIGDERENPQIIFECISQSLRGALALGTVDILHLVQNRFDGQFLAIERKAQ